MYSKDDDRPIERSLHIEKTLKEACAKIAVLEEQTGWRLLIQWGEPLWTLESSDLSDFDIIIALSDVERRGGAKWTIRVASSVDHETLDAVRSQSRLLTRDFAQTSPEFALERYIDSLLRTLPPKQGHQDTQGAANL